jgi:hypothetical protein
LREGCDIKHRGLSEHKIAAFIALAEALKALATDLKKQLDAQPQSRYNWLYPEA